MVIASVNLVLGAVILAKELFAVVVTCGFNLTGIFFPAFRLGAGIAIAALFLRVPVSVAKRHLRADTRHGSFQFIFAQRIVFFSGFFAGDFSAPADFLLGIFYLIL